MLLARFQLRQAFWLFVCSRFILNLVSNPFFNELHNRQDIIPSLLLGILIQLLYVIVFIVLWKQFPDVTLIEYCKSILGRWPGNVVGLLYIVYFVIQACFTVRVFGEFLKTRFLIQTPIEVIGIGIMVIVVYAIYMGLEVLARLADILVPFIFGGMLLLAIFAFSEADWSNVKPTFETDLITMIKTMVPTATRWSELAWLAMLYPFIEQKKEIKLAIFGGIIFVNAFFFIINVTVVGIFGQEMVSSLKFPTLEMVESISIGSFLERIDALVLGLWVFGAFLKIGMYYYVVVLGISQWVGLRKEKVVIIPLGMIILLFSLLMFSNIVELSNFSKIIVPVDFIFTFVLPLLLLVIHLVKYKVRSVQQI